MSLWTQTIVNANGRLSLIALAGDKDGRKRDGGNESGDVRYW